jgi:hypothetical protein
MVIMPWSRRIAESFAVRSADGSVWGWGSNAEGELGDGTTSGRASPAQVPGLSDPRFDGAARRLVSR